MIMASVMKVLNQNDRKVIADGGSTLTYVNWQIILIKLWKKLLNDTLLTLSIIEPTGLN